MTTTFIISYIILALIIVGVINLFLIRSRKKGKRQQKEQQFTTRQSNQSKFKASDLDKTTDQSTQRMTHEELRVDNQDDHSQVSLNKQTEGSEQDQELFNDNKDDEAFAAKNPESEE
ncbi:TPA: MFS transporter, partial [Staphylococcus aureus]|nr:MFS transporter [Staphylococcus aureus]